MTFDPEAYFADVKTWPPVKERPKADAFPKGVFFEWSVSFDEVWDEPRCMACGAIGIKRDGLHLCEVCR